MRRRKREMDFNAQWGDLATYNAEVYRGIVHRPEYAAMMAAKQDVYNAMMRARAEANGDIVIDSTTGSRVQAAATE